MLQADVREHLERVEHDQTDALVFSSPAGTPMRHSNFYRRAWLPAVAKAGLSGVHFHDYADTWVMPMSGGSACSAVVSGVKMSA
jgi:hypothetical protein